jgi:PAS domain S-box-containing protein
VEVREQSEKPRKKAELISSKKSIDKKLEFYHQEIENKNFEIKRINTELEELKSNYSNLFNYAPIGYIILDKDYNIVSANKAFSDIVGVELDNINNNSFIKFANPNSKDELYDHFNSVIRTGESKCIQIVLDKNINVKIISNLFNIGNQILVKSSIIDITNLVQIQKTANEANNAKNQFLANMSHEIRTPLNGILGFLQLIESTELNTEQSEYIRNIKNSTDILIGIINDILDISKLESGEMDIEEISFDIRSTIESVVIPHTKIASEKGLELNMLMKSNVPQRVLGDPIKLRQVLTNLINNAIKFTDKGEIFIEVELKEESDKEVEIIYKVNDTGIGVSEEKINKLFLPFTQGDSSFTKKYGGTGLGLSISKKFVEMMKGNIYVKSNKGKGSTFIFTTKFKKSNDEDTINTGDYSVFKGKKILVVDENKMNCNITKIYLQELGAKVEEVRSIEEALAILLNDNYIKTTYDAVLVNYQTSSVSMHNFSKSLKAMPATKKIPLFLITSIAEKDEVKKAKESGFVGYLSKPFRRKEFLDCIAKVLYKNDNDSIFITRHAIREAEYHKKLKILIVEDNEVDRTILARKLQYKGYWCDVAENGLDAVNACKNNRYDIVFMDCQMPILDGYEATRIIRQEESDKNHVMIVALSSSCQRNDYDKCIKAGIDNYLNKPVEIESIMKIIKAKEEMKNPVKRITAYDEIIEKLIMELGFDKETSNELIMDFCQQAFGILERLKKYDESNYKKIEFLLHQLKGSASNIRAGNIQSKAAEGEEAIQNRDWGKFLKISEEMEYLLKDIIG